MEKKLVIYEPNKYVTAGWKFVWKQMCAELRSSWNLGFRLFLRDFTSKYKQSLLGLTWVMLLPLFTVLVFVIMNRSGILNIRNTGVPYPVYALFGISLWSLFTGLTASISGVVGQTGSLITKINFPRIALIQSPILTSIIDLLIRFILLFILMTYYRTTPHAEAFLLPLTLLPLLLLSIGIGMFLSIIGAVFKDIPNIINIFLTVAMFITPVMYPLPESGFLYAMNLYNPLYYFIEVPRNLFFMGTFQHLPAFTLFSLVSVTVFYMGWRFYYVAMNRIVEKV